MKRKQTAPKIQSEISSLPNQLDNTLKSDDTFVYALGGLGEVGKNMYCIEHEDNIIIIDSGVKFPEENLLGVDYVIPDYSHIIRNEKKIKALIITHGHEDHIGGIPFLLQSVKIPKIYAPRFARSLIMKKLEEKRMTKRVVIEEIDESSRIECGPLVVGFFNTVHSIPDSLGVLINTPNGRIVETGDFKFDLTPIGTNTDYQKLAYIGQIGVTLLMSDSTNAEVADFSISEKKVAQSILDIVRKARGRIIISTFSANLHELPGASSDPSTMQWWEGHPKAWAEARKDPQLPELVMPKYVEWLKGLGEKIVFVAWPATYDFMFVYWYLMHFAGESPFGYSGLDLRSYTMCMGKECSWVDFSMQRIPQEWIPVNIFPHKAVCDATQQGYMACYAIVANLS